MAIRVVRLERTRIDLEIRAIVVPYLEEQALKNANQRAAYRSRARPLLARLERAVPPYPDLRERLSAAREALELA